jgi:hypothetical protein
MRNIADKGHGGHQKTHFSVQQRFLENRALYEIKWKNIVEPVRSQMAKWRMRTACWIHKATTHTQSM